MRSATICWIWGLTPTAEIALQKIAPIGDPVQIELRGYEWTLRRNEAQKITVEQVHEKECIPRGEQRRSAVAHPGMGELGRAKSYHVHDAATEIPKGANIRFALAGNQNCGKTTLSNQFTPIFPAAPSGELTSQQKSG